MRKFNVGDTVVHLSHGLGTVVGIEKREFTANKVQEFYILNIDDVGAPKKVFVLVEQAEARLRAVVTRGEAERVVKYIQSGKDELSIVGDTWNRRYRDYMERIHTGNLYEIAQVYVSVTALGENKGLSFGERKLLELAKERLGKELAELGIQAVFNT